MTTDVPLRMQIRTEMCIDGCVSSFRAKLKPAVTGASTGRTRRKRLAYELLALAHVASTA